MTGPRDEKGDGSTLQIKTLEHDEHMVPQTIRVTDSEGRTAVYHIGEEYQEEAIPTPAPSEQTDARRLPR